MLKSIDTEKIRSLIAEAQEYIWKNPETGFKEYKTHAFLKKKMEELGYNVCEQKDITGFYSVIDTGREGPTLLLLAELDSVICSSHPDCNKVTGAVHACGHHMQCAALLGVAAALKEKGALDGLCGKIKLCFVPAEEGIEYDFRKELKQKGIIKYFCGKDEYIRRGCFEDADIAFMVHVDTHCGSGKEFSLDIGHNGYIRKRTTFKGFSAHAGTPYDGINALNTASAAINAVNSLRETFKEKDYVRIHGIITHGGDSVNAVPDKVVFESFVRAANVEALQKANDKVNRAFAGVACAFGGNVHVEDVAGSEPLIDDVNLNAVAAEVLTEFVGKDKFEYDSSNKPSSTDMGDLSTLTPSIHAYSNCCIGNDHGSNFKVADKELGGIKTAEFQLRLINKLLENNAEKAKYVIDNFKPLFKNKEEYIRHKDSFEKDTDLLTYNADGSVTVNA